MPISRSVWPVDAAGRSRARSCHRMGDVGAGPARVPGRASAWADSAWVGVVLDQNPVLGASEGELLPGHFKVADLRVNWQVRACSGHTMVYLLYCYTCNSRLLANEAYQRDRARHY